MTYKLEATGHLVAPAGSLAMALVVGRMFAMEPSRVMAFKGMLDEMPVAELARARSEWLARSSPSAAPDGGRGGYRVVQGDTAVVDMVGAMSKRETCMGEMFGGEASTVAVERALRAAAKDPDVKQRFLVIESPGGVVGGAFALSEYVYEQRKSGKPIYAYMDDECMSAAQLVSGSAAGSWGNMNLNSGSVGVYTMLADTSVAQAMRGVKLHLVKAGANKAIGAPGQPVTTDQLSVIQARVDSLHRLFGRSLKRGRGLTDDELARVMDATVYVGEQGVRVGLLDGIMSLDAAIEAARSHTTVTTRNRKIMAVQGTRQPAANADVHADDDVSILQDAADMLAAAEADTATDTTATDVTAPVSAAELTAALEATGAQDFAGLVALANFGADHVQKLRATAKKMVVLAYGSTGGVAMHADIDKMGPVAALDQIKRAKVAADGQALAGDNAQRLSVPSQADIVVGRRRTAASGNPADAVADGQPSNGAGAGAGTSLKERVAQASAELRQAGIY